MTVDLNDLSLDEIRALERLAEQRKAELREGLRLKVDTLIHRNGFKICELYPGHFRRRSVPRPRFANPINRSETWSGLGRSPMWVREHLAAGGQLYDLAI